VLAVREFAGTVTVAWTRPGGTRTDAALGLPAARSVWVAEA